MHVDNYYFFCRLLMYTFREAVALVLIRNNLQLLPGFLGYFQFFCVSKWAVNNTKYTLSLTCCYLLSLIHSAATDVTIISYIRKDLHMLLYRNNESPVFQLLLSFLSIEPLLI